MNGSKERMTYLLALNVAEMSSTYPTDTMCSRFFQFTMVRSMMTNSINNSIVQSIRESCLSEFDSGKVSQCLQITRDNGSQKALVHSGAQAFDWNMYTWKKRVKANSLKKENHLSLQTSIVNL